MKLKHFLPLIAIVMGFGSCTNDLVDEVSPIMGNRDVISVSMENTRTAMEGTSVIWSDNDAIGIFIGATNNEYALATGAGTTSAEFQSSKLVRQATKEVAYFPYVSTAAWNSSTKTITTSLPATYEYAEGTNNNAVMAALMSEENQSSISFKNAGALYAITIENIPAGYTKAVMTYTNTEDNVAIAGAATITFDGEGNPTLAVDDAASAAEALKIITITFDAADAPTTKTFYFPMPIYTGEGEGYAENLQFSLQGDDKEAINAPVFTQEPQRSKLYAATLKLDAVSGGIVSEANDIDAANAALADEAVTSVAVKDATDTDAITIPAKSESAADVEHTIDLSEATLPTTGSVNIVVEQGAGEKATVEKLTVIVPEGASAGSYTINAPGTTVTIQAANGTVIETIEATTADNTLIIGEGVTIKNLDIKKGNVALYGNVENIKSDDATTIKLMDDITLKNAITITKGNVTIDLNGYTIENKSANNTTQLGNAADECIVFYVDGAEANLTLNATNGGKVIATGDGTTSFYNVAVWVTNGATTTINGGEYSNTADPENDGCDLIYGRDGGKIYVKGGTFKAGAIRSNLGGGIYGVLNCKDSKGSVITVSGGKFYEYGAAEAAKVGNGEVILLQGGYYWSAKDAAGYYTVTDKIETEEALKSAIAAGVDNITLGADITLSSVVNIRKTVTINLNGKDIIHPASSGDAYGDVFDVLTGGNLTILGEGSVISENGYSVYAGGDAKVLLEKGKYYSPVSAVYAQSSAVVTIEDGEYYADIEPAKNSPEDSAIYGHKFTLNLKDSSAAQIVVKGGKFYKYNPAGSESENPHANFVAPGYSAVANGDYYEVKPGIYNETALKGAIVNSAEITLDDDIEITDAITIAGGKEVTINLNGKTIENKTAGHPSMISPEVDDECVVFMVTDGKLTIEGEGNVKATGDDEKSDYNVAVWVMGENAEAVINGGTYTNSTDTESDGCDLIYGRNGAKITINGGSFQSHIRSTLGGGNGTYDVLDCKDYKAGSIAQSTITVNGGKFQNYAPSYENVGTNEVVLGNSKAVYNGVNIVTTKHDITAADIWYEVR